MKSYFVLVFLSFFLLSAFIITMFHEQAHVSIFRNYGCVSHVSFNWQTVTYETIPDYCPKGPDIQVMMYLQSQAEMLGYHVMAALLTIWLIFFAYVMVTQYER